MTRDEVLAMPAGRELDALVAERLFGVRIFTQAEMEAEARRVWADQPRCEWFAMGFYATKLGRDDIECRQEIRHYSTNIAEAWPIAVMFRMDVHNLSNNKGAARVHAINGDQVWPTYQVNADTPALAICRAALLTTLESR